MRIYDNILTGILVLFVAYTSQAQFFFLPPPLWSTTAAPVVTAKGAITAQLGAEATALAAASVFLNKLKKTERDYDNKRKLSTVLDPRNSLLIGTALTSIEDTERIINNVQSDVSTIGVSKVYFKYRLDEIDTELKLEKKYIDEIQADYLWLSLGSAAGGGAGYTYKAFLKVLLRSMKIRRRVMILKKEVDNLNTANKMFIRK